MIGSYSWAMNWGGNSGGSLAQSGDTYCSGCAVNVSDVAIIKSVAVSNTHGKLCRCLHSVHIFDLRCIDPHHQEKD